MGGRQLDVKRSTGHSDPDVMVLGTGWFRGLAFPALSGKFPAILMRDVIRQLTGSAGALPGAAPIGTAHSTTKCSAPCG